MREIEHDDVELASAQAGSVRYAGKAELCGIDGVQDDVARSFEGGDVGGGLWVLG